MMKLTPTIKGLITAVAMIAVGLILYFKNVSPTSSLMFIVVTLFMALYTFTFYKANPNLIEEKAALTKTELLKTEKNRTPAEIDTMIENGKKNFAVLATSVSIFQYLLVGAIVTAATAGMLSLSNKK